eukprot:CAMPEP_0196208550 /NCGR_PEP_ID=MMETSP0912-20130531/9107_1 /TAXON_ID=49265 /ORGANISM="Thalassiosira rotula, Strain GSO102" /LENGTH=80 /DNA_ID=CAMNT_0041483361 /DNA_START=364 /DNA_END=606 /DNA_ORIENTATION=-
MHGCACVALYLFNGICLSFSLSLFLFHLLRFLGSSNLVLGIGIEFRLCGEELLDDYRECSEEEDESEEFERVFGGPMHIV